ncbi:MAG: PLP-dependent aminotransferase family protein [Anaerolineae bacterium]|nr:PLP-dependent aminotransferase family protein [Anaerolineae bacterium]
MTTKWAERYASRVEKMQSSAIREILKITQEPDIISFAGGLPAPELFPVQRIMEASQHALEEQGSTALQYTITEGYPPLREMIVEHMGRYGINCDINNILITAGSQQALDLIGKVFLDAGDNIMVEQPTYLGAIQAWNVYDVQYVTVPTDDDGMLIDGLEQALETNKAKFIYAMPNFQNPMGISTPSVRRKEIVRLADHYNMPIVEDDPYGQLRYEGDDELPLIALDAQLRAENSERFTTGNVIYLSTFSKTLCPGFRVAWVTAPEDVIFRLVQAKQAADLHTGTLAQVVAHETARDGFIEKHVAELRRVYGERRDLMLSLLEELFPPGVTWTRPKGGLFLWIRLPEGMNSTELLKKAVEQKVAFVPGSPFYPLGGGENTMRINFSNALPEQIEEGMKRLAAVIKAAMQSSNP